MVVLETDVPTMPRLLLSLALAALAASGCAEPPGLSPEQVAIFEQPVDAELVVGADKNAMRYSVARVTAPAGATVRLVMDNSVTTSPAMIHNVVVLSDAGAIERVGLAAAAEEDNIPDDPAVRFYTPLTRPGQRSAVVFTMPPPGEYPFICTFPGHWAAMQGTLVSTAP